MPKQYTGDQLGIITNLMTERLREGDIVCWSLCINTFMVVSIMVSLTTLQ